MIFRQLSYYKPVWDGDIPLFQNALQNRFLPKGQIEPTIVLLAIRSANYATFSQKNLKISHNATNLLQD